MLERRPYSGSKRQLVIAFDIGTTFSGISYCILQPGQVPKPQGVLKYPKQGIINDLKVPSIMYYDADGLLRAVGYEVLQESTIEKAIEEEWVKVEWWKLHLRPKHLSSNHIKDDDIPPLPKGKTVVDVFTDFIKFLFKCAETYIREHHPEYLWDSVKDELQFIFTHPNGWEGMQQKQMRHAIERAGLIPSTGEGRTSVRFLTEGEAGLHFCMWELFESGVPDQGQYPQGQGIVVIDAGGGTIDLSMYSMELNPTSFGEIAPAECRLQGSVFVTRRGNELLKEKLNGSRYAEEIDDITDKFDAKTKLEISSAEEPIFIKFGKIGDKDPDYNIRNGKLRLSGQEVTKLFDESIKAIIDAFEEQRKHVTIPITMGFLIGGFGANDWLWSQLKGYFEPKGIQLSRPNRVQKAVPDGAISHYIDNLVTSRIARATYGTSCAIYVDTNNHEHLRRGKTWYMAPNGLLSVPNVFQGILHKGDQAHELEEFRHEFIFDRESRSQYGVELVPVMCYRGALQDPQWSDLDEASFAIECNIRCDLRDAARSLAPQKKLGNQSGIYYSLSFEVIILFGLTEFCAQVAWKENGIEKRSPAEMIYDEI